MTIGGLAVSQGQKTCKSFESKQVTLASAAFWAGFYMIFATSQHDRRRQRE